MLLAEIDADRAERWRRLSVMCSVVMMALAIAIAMVALSHPEWTGQQEMISRAGIAAGGWN